MAEFCAQCADYYEFPRSDFIGLTRQEDWDKGLAVVAICEGCGVIQVDPAGRCCGDCLKGHPEVDF